MPVGSPCYHLQEFTLHLVSVCFGRLDAEAAGLTAQAVACFGLSAACCRTGFLLAGRLSWLAAPAGLGMSITFSSLGFMLQTLGFKDGHSVIVCTCAAVSSMVTGERHHILTNLAVHRAC